MIIIFPESLISLERSQELTSSSPAGNRRKPIPPKKRSKNQFDSIEQYLRAKGQPGLIDAMIVYFFVLGCVDRC